MAIELICETHSTSTDNEAGIATGWLPGALSEEGRRQALKLGARRIATPFPDGQSYQQVVDQTRDFLRDLAAEWDGRKVLIIACSANR